MLAALRPPPPHLQTFSVIVSEEVWRMWNVTVMFMFLHRGRKQQ